MAPPGCLLRVFRKTEDKPASKATFFLAAPRRRWETPFARTSEDPPSSSSASGSLLLANQPAEHRGRTRDDTWSTDAARAAAAGMRISLMLGSPPAPHKLLQQPILLKDRSAYGKHAGPFGVATTQVGLEVGDVGIETMIDDVGIDLDTHGCKPPMALPSTSTLEHPPPPAHRTTASSALRGCAVDRGTHRGWSCGRGPRFGSPWGRSSSWRVPGSGRPPRGSLGSPGGGRPGVGAGPDQAATSSAGTTAGRLIGLSGFARAATPRASRACS